MSAETELPAVTMAYVHSNECTMSFHHSFVNLLNFDLGHGARVMRGGFVAINSGTNGLVESRNMAISIFLDEKKSDWLFWVDTDMGFLPETLERLVEAADPIERPIVALRRFQRLEKSHDIDVEWQRLF